MSDDRRRPASPPRWRPPVLRAPRTKSHMSGRWVGVTALVMTAVVLPSTSASAGTDPAPAGAAAVDELIRAEMAASFIPGAAVAITRGDEVLLVRGYGHDSRGAPVTGGTPFRVASLSKSFTSLAVLQLADAGLLSLDDRVVQHLPAFRLADPRGAGITVRQLLDQTSGLADQAFSELDRPQPTSTTEAVASMSSAHLVAAPGTRWNYHNPNYHVAARLVEVLSGERFDDYLHHHVFEPAGMDATSTTTMSTDPVPGLAPGHVVAYGKPIATEGLTTFEAGAGGVVSTAADMADWLIVHANDGRAADGARLVTEGGVTEMHTGRAPVGYALGWDTEGPVDAPTRVEHSGNLLTYSAFQAVLPDSGYGVALLFNSGSAFLLEQSATFEGVLDVVEGADVITRGPRFSTTTQDAALASSTVVVLLFGTRGILTSRRWAARHGPSGARAMLRMVPLLGVVGLVAAFPYLAQLLYSGRDVTWLGAAYGWPALVVFVAASLVAAAATVVARVSQFGRHRATGLGAGESRTMELGEVTTRGHAPPDEDVAEVARLRAGGEPGLLGDITTVPLSSRRPEESA